MKIFSSNQLYQADQLTTERQEITSTDLMERAGIQIFNWLHERLQGAQLPIHIFCGIGNNGGDGLVVGRLLIENGYKVNVLIVNFSDKRSKDFLINYDRIKNVSNIWPKLMSSESDFPTIAEDDIIIDAIFGIGLNRSLNGWVKQLIQYLNNHSTFKLAIDIPSGLFANHPIDDPEAVLIADHTLTFQTPKLAFFLPETDKYTPYYEVLDIGLDLAFLNAAEPLAHVILKAEAQVLYRQRKKNDHKGTFGHALIVAGSYGKIGAAILASKSAFRAGVGLVSCFIPKCGYSIVQTALPEAMVITDVNDNIISDIKIDFQPSAIAVGMGIGTHKETISALKTLFSETKASFVIDADALNCISKDKELLKLLPKNSILTPHLGELKRLIGEWNNDYDRLEKAKKFSVMHKAILIIKGANTITVNGNDLYINTTGNPGMATAGSGDALSGVIVGLLSQGYDPLSSSIFGVYLHGSAGNIIAQKISYEAIIASDIIDNLGNAYLALFEQGQTSKEQDYKEEK